MDCHARCPASPEGYFLSARDSCPLSHRPRSLDAHPLLWLTVVRSGHSWTKGSIYNIFCKLKLLSSKFKQYPQFLNFLGLNLKVYIPVVTTYPAFFFLLALTGNTKVNLHCLPMSSRFSLYVKVLNKLVITT